MSTSRTRKQSFGNHISDAPMITNPTVLSTRSFHRLSTPPAPSRHQGHRTGVKQNVPVKGEAQSPPSLCSSPPGPPLGWGTAPAQPWAVGRSLLTPGRAGHPAGGSHRPLALCAAPGGASRRGYRSRALCAGALEATCAAAASVKTDSAN